MCLPILTGTFRALDLPEPCMINFEQGIVLNALIEFFVK
jgi:hypothetical protein